MMRIFPHLSKKPAIFYFKLAKIWY